MAARCTDLEQATAQVDNTEHSCVLSPGGAQLSWAMYDFPNLLPEDAPLAFSLLPLGELPPNPCYLGFADYLRGTWNWTELGVGQEQYNVGVGAGAGALSPGGSLYVVVATYGTPLAIGGLRLQLDCPAPPPDGFMVEPGDGDMLLAHLSWIDPALSFDPDGSGARAVRLRRRAAATRHAPDGPWTDAVQLPPGTTGWDDPLSISGNPLPEGNFYYHIMTLVTGATPLSGVSRFGGLDLTAALMFEAKFTMSPASGNSGQLVVFDGTGSLTVGGSLTSVKWDFDGDGKFDETTTPALTTTHTYASAGRYYPRLLLVEDVGGGSSKD